MKSTVLVIESEPWLGDHYQLQLETNGYTVVRASHAFDAIEIINDETPLAIVMSLLLDGPGALNLLHELQSYSDTASIPVVVCSARSDVSLDELEPYGVKEVLNSTMMKPDDVVRAVRSVSMVES